MPFVCFHPSFGWHSIVLVALHLGPIPHPIHQGHQVLSTLDIVGAFHASLDVFELL
jgi:hypothetical protein